MKSFNVFLQEKLISPGRGEKYGQVIFLAGGAGSGKSFAVSNFIDSAKYKQINPDDIKQLMIKSAAKEGSPFAELRGVDMTTPEGSQQAHELMNDKRLSSRKTKAILNPEGKSILPNLMFDRTLSYPGEIEKLSRRLVRAGYKPNNIHVVWVLTDVKVALAQNTARGKKGGRQLPDDVIIQTHKGAAGNMRDLIFSRLSASVNGEIHIIFGGPENTFYWTDNKGQPLDGKNKPMLVKNFKSLKVKEAGKRLDRTGAIARKVSGVLGSALQS